MKSASLMNNGQACVAQTRILVSERRRDEVVDALAEMMSGLQVGDPADDATDVDAAPVVKIRRRRDRLDRHIGGGGESRHSEDRCCSKKTLLNHHLHFKPHQIVQKQPRTGTSRGLPKKMSPNCNKKRLS